MMRVYARKEVVVSGGRFNSPQILKLSGIGPTAELDKFNIPLVVDLPGMGPNLQDNDEIGVVARASTDLPNKSPSCTFGFAGGPDPCLEASQHGTRPYATGPLDALMFKTSKAAYGEKDSFMWGNPAHPVAPGPQTLSTSLHSILPAQSALYGKNIPPKSSGDSHTSIK
jgi:choline dehydrogenase